MFHVKQVTRLLVVHRRPALTVTGLAWLCLAAWLAHVIAGCVMIGLSCLVLEALTDKRGNG